MTEEVESGAYTVSLRETAIRCGDICLNTMADATVADVEFLPPDDILIVDPTPPPIQQDPTDAPTDEPVPTLEPTRYPTTSPIIFPTQEPTLYPTSDPTNDPPTLFPTLSPTLSPMVPTLFPTTLEPTRYPTDYVSQCLCLSPFYIYPLFCDSKNSHLLCCTTQPTLNPTLEPTRTITEFPTLDPTTSPTLAPTLSPTISPVSSLHLVVCRVAFSFLFANNLSLICFHNPF